MEGSSHIFWASYIKSIFRFLKQTRYSGVFRRASHSKSNHIQVNKQSPQFRSAVNVSLNKISCNFCSSSHSIYFCADFLKLNVNERWDKMKALRLCTNCLRADHSVQACNLASCRKCGRKHNTLLHYNSRNNHTPINSNNNNHNNSSSHSSHHPNNNPEHSNVLLQHTEFLQHTNYLIPFPYYPPWPSK